MMTYFTPISASILAAISPVKAPFGASCMVSAPTRILVPRMAFWAVLIFRAGRHTTISQSAFLGRRGAISSAKATVSVAVLFIFQLPAMIVLRYFLFIVALPLF